MLASYATQSSVGRRYLEPGAKYRNDFQRDRDRIIHSSAFRRLEYKTQVFINHEGDLFRTRLTHSLEVAQIGRSVANALQLNQDLVEAICLAHDLGHTPFGHSGQEVLNKCMQGHGGFEHNLQSLRIVDQLEECYADFNGLNLCFETRSGILKHCNIATARTLGDVGLRFVENRSPSLEAQLANVADELAYNYHDIDDGLRAGLLNLSQLTEVEILKINLLMVQKKYPKLMGRRLEKELIRHLINATIDDLITNSLVNINSKIDSDLSNQTSKINIISYSKEMGQNQHLLKKFLSKNLYYHQRVIEFRFKTENILRSLFNAYIDEPNLLPAQYQNHLAVDSKHRVVADYLSGMTDRYAFRQYNHLFGVEII